MPWKVANTMELKKKFVLRVLGGEKLTDVCNEFGITRQTGHKFLKRFKEFGERGLEDQSRRPKTLGKQLDLATTSFLLKLKKEKPTWGAPKLRELFIRKCPNLNPPAVSTIHALLDRHGLVKRGRQANHLGKATGTYLSQPRNPNDLWCTDFKGQFRLQNQTYCYPLTISDQVSRHLFAVEAMERIQENEVINLFEEVFREFGLPDGIRSDNGVPFATRGIWGLSKLSVWWIRLGIKLERIKPGNPQQNGRHERMHRSLKIATTRPPARNLLAQQELFDHFIQEYNKERPHEGLGMKTPGEVYQGSKRSFPAILEEPDYKNHDYVLRVYSEGELRLPNRGARVWIGQPMAGQLLGVTQVDDKVWEVAFMDYVLGHFDDTQMKLTIAPNPFSLATAHAT